MDNQLVTGFSLIYLREDGRSSFLAVDQFTDAYLSMLNLFMQGMSRTLSGPETFSMDNYCANSEIEDRCHMIGKKGLCCESLNVCILTIRNTCFIVVLLRHILTRSNKKWLHPELYMGYNVPVGIDRHVFNIQMENN